MQPNEKEFSNEDRIKAVIDAYLRKEGVKVVANRLGISTRTLQAWKERLISDTGQGFVKNVFITNKRLVTYNDEDRIFTFPISTIPLLIGFMYILGYIRISMILQEYHVAPIYLFDAVYFTAGFVPFLALLIVYLVIYYVWYPDEFNLRLLKKFGEWLSEKIKEFFSRYYKWLIIGGYIAIIIDDLATSKPLLDGPSFFGLMALSLYSLLGIGILVYYIRRAVSDPKSIGQLVEQFNNESMIKERTKILSFKLFILLLSLIATIYSLWVMVSTIDIIYRELPQEFGGKELSTIRLILDIDKVTDTLQTDLVIDSLGRTEPLCLIYSSQNNYIVTDKCGDNFEKLWVLNSNVVLGEISENK